MQSTKAFESAAQPWRLLSFSGKAEYLAVSSACSVVGGEPPENTPTIARPSALPYSKFKLCCRTTATPAAVVANELNKLPNPEEACVGMICDWDCCLVAPSFRPFIEALRGIDFEPVLENDPPERLLRPILGNVNFVNF